MSDREDFYKELPNKHQKLPENKLLHELLSFSDYNGSAATTHSGRDNKSGWYDIHQKHVSLLLNSKTILVFIGDSIIAGLSCYVNIWRTFFKTFDTLNYGISGDHMKHVLLRAETATLQNSLKYVVIHCGTNNIDCNQPRDIANGVISIGLTLQEKCRGLKVIVTGLLPRDSEWSQRRKKIKLINYYLKKLCRDRFDDFYFMKQDDDWTDEDGKLDEKLYYTDQLHLVEAGNRKFACSILKILSKLMQDEKVSYSSDENEIKIYNSVSFERGHGWKRKTYYLFEFNSNVNHCKLVRPVSHSKLTRPVSYSKPVRPVNHRKLVFPVKCKSVRPASHSKSVCRIIYSKPVRPVNHCKPVRPVSHGKTICRVSYSKRVRPLNHSKFVYPVNYSKSVCPVSYLILIFFISSFIIFLNRGVFKLFTFYLNILINFHMTFLIFTKYFKSIYIFNIFLFSTSVDQYLLLYLFVNKTLNFYSPFDISVKLKPFLFFMILTSLALTTFVTFFGRLSKIFLCKVYTMFLRILKKIFKSPFLHFGKIS